MSKKDSGISRYWLGIWQLELSYITDGSVNWYHHSGILFGTIYEP